MRSSAILISQPPVVSFCNKIVSNHLRSLNGTYIVMNYICAVIGFAIISVMVN